MTKIRALLFAALALLGLTTGALAQSSPNLIYGQVPTAAQWNSYFIHKQDVLGFTPVNKAGDVMTGRLITTASTISQAGFNVPHGTAPITPVNGDLWTTTSGIFARINGATVTITTGTSSIPTIATGDLLYGSAANVLSALSDVATGNALVSGGVGVAPAWGKIGLATHITGVLAVANGGSNCSVASGTCLDNITAFASTGILTRTAAGTYAFRTITGTASRVSMTNGNGVSGAPTIDIDAAYVGQTSITTLGTIGAGTWQAGVVGGTYGGTGVNNGAFTVTLSGSVVHSGAFTRTITVTATTNSTLPAGTHTLAGLDVVQTWSAAQGFADTTLQLNGATSGRLILKTGAIAGSNTLTFPIGTTDFTATGGANQYLKQLTSGGAITVGVIAAADLPLGSSSAFGAVKVDGTTITASGGVITAIGAAATSISVGTTTVGSGTTTRVLFDNAGVLGEYTISGTGNVCMTTSCAMTTPALGTPSAAVLTNATGLPIDGGTVNTLPLNRGGTAGTTGPTAWTGLGGATNNASNGSVTFPNGLIMKWGSVAAGASVNTITFGAAFPTAIFTAMCTPDSADQAHGTAFTANSSALTTSSFSCSLTVQAGATTGSTTSTGTRWVAFGN